MAPNGNSDAPPVPRKVLHSSPVKAASSPFKAKLSRPEEGSGKAPAKLPAFPAKKESSVTFKSPSKAGPRQDALPTVPAHGTNERATGNITRSKSGVERLSSLQRHAGEDLGTTHGFESPRRQEHAEQIAKDEVRTYMQRRHAARASDADLCGHSSSEDDADAPERSPRVPRTTDDDDVRKSNGMDQSPTQRSAAFSPIPLQPSRQRSRELAPVATSMTEGEFQAFTRDIAARIIQASWRRWQQWKLKLRRDAEQRILQQLLDGDGGALKLLVSGVFGSQEQPSAEGTRSRDRPKAGAAAPPASQDAKPCDEQAGAGDRARAGVKRPAEERAEARQVPSSHGSADTAGAAHTPDPARVRPSKKHPGGHSVYTFIPEPRSAPQTPQRKAQDNTDERTEDPLHQAPVAGTKPAADVSWNDEAAGVVPAQAAVANARKDVGDNRPSAGTSIDRSRQEEPSRDATSSSGEDDSDTTDGRRPWPRQERSSRTDGPAGQHHVGHRPESSEPVDAVPETLRTHSRKDVGTASASRSTTDADSQNAALLRRSSQAAASARSSDAGISRQYQTGEGARHSRQSDSAITDAKAAGRASSPPGTGSAARASSTDEVPGPTHGAADSSSVPASPRRQARSEALQRLKQQGSQRSILAGGFASGGGASSRPSTSAGAGSDSDVAAPSAAASASNAASAAEPASRSHREPQSGAQRRSSSSLDASANDGNAAHRAEALQAYNGFHRPSGDVAPHAQRARPASPGSRGAVSQQQQQAVPQSPVARKGPAQDGPQVLRMDRSEALLREAVARPKSAADPWASCAGHTGNTASHEGNARSQGRPQSAHASLHPTTAAAGGSDASSSDSELEAPESSAGGRPHGMPPLQQPLRRSQQQRASTQQQQAWADGTGSAPGPEGAGLEQQRLAYDGRAPPYYRDMPDRPPQEPGRTSMDRNRRLSSNGRIIAAWSQEEPSQQALHASARLDPSSSSIRHSAGLFSTPNAADAPPPLAMSHAQHAAAVVAAAEQQRVGYQPPALSQSVRSSAAATASQSGAATSAPRQEAVLHKAGAAAATAKPPGAALPAGPALLNGAGRQPPDPDAAPNASLTAEKMTSILKYLDEVEQQAEQDVSRAATFGNAMRAEPSATSPRTMRAGGTSRRATSHSRPGTARSGGVPQRQQAKPNEGASAQGTGSRSRGASPPLQDSTYDDGDAASADGASVASGANRSAFLAESVYDSVRAKIRRLQDDVKDRDARICSLQQDLEELQQVQRTMLLDSDMRLQEMLTAQRAEYEAAVARHLAFVDRLLADKDVLTRRVTELGEQLKGSDERQERAIAKLKEGWASELKRQKDSWAAAEKVRRDQWMEAKAAEIKDLTVKGLEGEVQKLLARHKAELAAVQQSAGDEARKQLDAYIAQNELAVRQLRERLVHDSEEAVEKERAVGAQRLREVSERYEQQLQTQRMRLVADADLKLEQLDTSRKDEKRRFDEALAQARESADERAKEAEETWKREKEALRKAHDKQLEALREQYETGQEGWRAAMAERARKEVAERTAAIKDKLMQERNEEIEAIMARLEAEHAMAKEQLKEEFRRRQEATAAQQAAALKEARKAEAKMAERFRTAGLAAQAAGDRASSSEMQHKELRRELDSKNSTIRWLESQVSAAKEEAHAREKDLRSLGAQREALQGEAVFAVQRDKQQAEARLAQAVQEQQELRSKHAAEMSHVEDRIKATLAKKDEAIAQLREQLAATAAELRSTREVLRQQQDEMDEEFEGYE